MFVKLGDTKEEYNSDRWADKFNECSDKKVKDPSAVNFFIFDSYSKKQGYADRTSHGKRNSNRPYVLIDWVRLDHKVQSPEEHEMGHAFGLDHVYVKGAKITDSTNIMASAESGEGSGGLRDIGFNNKQVATIREYAVRIRDRLNRK